MPGKVSVKDPFEINLDCVHCGFCLPKCPTYQVLGDENDSPRGRIYLMDLVREGRLPLDQTVMKHLDRCLGCRACETACPSGVRYELMLNQTRAQIHESRPPSWVQRFAFRRILPSPGLLRHGARLARLYQSTLQRWVRSSRILSRLAPKLVEMERKLPAVPPPDRLKAFYPAQGPRRARVGFLSGCVMPILFPEVHRASIQLLQRAGCEVVVPPGQRCCGALHSHAGDQEGAARQARVNLQAFPWRELDAVVVNSAGCGAAMKEWSHLPGSTDEMARFSHKVKDVCEFLVELDPTWELGPLPLRVAYDDPCHLLHGQGIYSQPRALMAQIPELTLLEVPNSERCCGSAGIYNLLQPEIAGQLLDRKLDEILSVDPQRVTTANPGCLMQIRFGLENSGAPIPVQHPVELLYESVRTIPA